MAEAFGADRAAAVCRELTKTHEEVRRGGLAELATWAADGVRGEVTLVVSGADPAAALDGDPDTLRAAVAAREDDGLSRKEAIVEVAKLSGVPRREVYDLVTRTGSHDPAPALPPRRVHLRRHRPGPARRRPGRAAARLARARDRPGARSLRTCTRQACAPTRRTSAATPGVHGRAASRLRPPAPRGRRGRADRDHRAPVHLVGHDWGGAIGWLVAAKRPDLVRSWTSVVDAAHQGLRPGAGDVQAGA